MNKYTIITDFHASRSGRIGASDIPILAGVSKYKTPVALFFEKIGEGEKDDMTDHPPFWWGHHLEAPILKRYCLNNYDGENNNITEMFSAHVAGTPVSDGNIFKILTEATHPEYDWAIAHADLLVHNDKPHLVQAKSSNFFMSGKSDDFTRYSDSDYSEAGIPASVYLQEQWEMLCYGLDTAYVAVLINTNDFRVYGPIKANSRVQEKCLALAANFMECIKSKTPPEPQTKADIDKLFPKTSGKTKMIGGDDLLLAKEMIIERKEIDAKIKKMQTKKADIENALYLMAGDNDVIASPEGDQLVKITAVTSERVKGLKEIKKSNPELETQLRNAGLVSSSTSRRMTIKMEV